MFKLFGLLMFFLLLLLVGCNRSSEEVVESSINDQMRFHMTFMLFYHTARESGPQWQRSISSVREDWREIFTDLVLVHSEDEAIGFREDVIVAWPSDRTYLIVDAFNREIRLSEGELDPESFGLTYPITVEDTVNYWQQVDDFFMSFEAYDWITENARLPEPRIWDDDGNLIDIDGNIIEHEDTDDD